MYNRDQVWNGTKSCWLSCWSIISCNDGLNIYVWFSVLIISLNYERNF